MSKRRNIRAITAGRQRRGQSIDARAYRILMADRKKSAKERKKILQEWAEGVESLSPEDRAIHDKLQAALKKRMEEE